jgi:hypothetical protein
VFCKKVNLTLCLINKALHHVGVWGSGCVDPCVLGFGNRWRWVVSFASLLLYSPWKNPRYPLDRSPRASLDAVERRKIFPLLGLELQPLGRPARRNSLYRLRYPKSFSTYGGKIIRYNEAPVAHAVCKAVYSNTTCSQKYFWQNIQSVVGGKVNDIGGHSIGHSKHKSVYVYLGNRSE